MKMLKNLSIAFLVVSSMQLQADAASIMADTKKLAADTAAQNIKNIQTHAAQKETSASTADKQKYLASLKKRIDEIRLTRATTAQNIESILLQVAGANVNIIQPKYLENPKGIKEAAKKLAKETDDQATAARRKSGYKTQYTPTLKTKVAELRKAKSPADQIEALLLEDYYS